jgi:hypothetical protein
MEHENRFVLVDPASSRASARAPALALAPASSRAPAPASSRAPAQSSGNFGARGGGDCAAVRATSRVNSGAGGGGCAAVRESKPVEFSFGELNFDDLQKSDRSSAHPPQRERGSPKSSMFCLLYNKLEFNSTFPKLADSSRVVEMLTGFYNLLANMIENGQILPPQASTVFRAKLQRKKAGLPFNLLRIQQFLQMHGKQTELGADNIRYMLLLSIPKPELWKMCDCERLVAMLEGLDSRSSTYYSMYFAVMMSMTTIYDSRDLTTEFVKWFKATINSEDLEQMSEELHGILERIDVFVKKMFKELKKEPVTDREQLRQSALRTGFVFLDEDDELSQTTNGTRCSENSARSKPPMSWVNSLLKTMLEVMRLMQEHPHSKFYGSLQDPTLFQEFLNKLTQFMRFRNTPVRGQQTLSGFLTEEIAKILLNVKRNLTRYRFDFHRLMKLLTLVAGSKVAQKWESYLEFSRKDEVTPTNWKTALFVLLIVLSLKQRRSKFANLEQVIASIFEKKTLNLSQQMAIIFESAKADMTQKFTEALGSP